MSYKVDFSEQLNGHFICDTLNVEFWAPSNKGRSVFLCRADEKESDEPPKVGSIQHFIFKKKSLNLRVSKIVYDTKRNAYKAFLNYTHDNKKPFEYAHKVFHFTITYTEPYPKALFDLDKQWMDSLKEQHPGSGVPVEPVRIIVPSKQELMRSGAI